MKGMMLGVAGLGGVGAAVYAGGGSSVNDFVGHVNKSPEAVYAAFSNLGQAGEVAMPSIDGWGSRLVQRVVKVPNEQVKLEFEMDGTVLISAEVQISPSEGGTRLAAELDFDSSKLRQLVREAGGGEVPVPTFAFEEFMLDQVFAQAMGEMVDRIERGQPLLSLADTHARWGRGGSLNGTFSHRSEQAEWQQRQAVRPQLDARPQLDPNAAARANSGGHTSDGW